MGLEGDRADANRIRHSVVDEIAIPKPRLVEAHNPKRLGIVLPGAPKRQSVCVTAPAATRRYDSAAAAAIWGLAPGNQSGLLSVPAIPYQLLDVGAN